MAASAGERMASSCPIERSSKGTLTSAFPPAETLKGDKSSNIAKTIDAQSH